jgi:hypothetical protein
MRRGQPRDFQLAIHCLQFTLPTFLNLGETGLLSPVQESGFNPTYGQAPTDHGEATVYLQVRCAIIKVGSENLQLEQSAIGVRQGRVSATLPPYMAVAG